MDVVLSQATGTAETEAALTMLERVPTARRVTVGADKGYDTREFVTTCRSFQITPHVAMKQRRSALDRRTSRHAGYAASQRARKRVEEVFGWLKTVGAGGSCVTAAWPATASGRRWLWRRTTSCAWRSSCPRHHLRGRSLPVEDEMPQPGVPAAQVGVGIQNYNDHLLEQLAQHGDGWYRYLFDVEQARSTFRRENWLALASPVADQTRAQVVWNPGAVGAWRIIGYENRVTSAASFTQDRKEFAEVYSGAATTVFYELELHDDFRQKGGLGQVELRWVEPESGRAWSQSSDLVSSGKVVHPHEDPLLRFGAVVALTADRYSALGDSPAPRSGYAQDLRGLRGLTEDLQDDLGHLTAFKDFAYVLEALLMSVPDVPADDSGYSR